jgi:hypothetical protein
MAQVHLDRNTNTKWVMAAVALAVAAAAAVWLSRPHDGDGSRVTAVQASATHASGVGVSDLPPMSASQVEAETKVIMASQQEAAKEVEKQPAMKPILGPVKDRPAFVSALEWQMLKGVAQQAADPDKELTRLVNFLRFNKQLELWESLASSPDKAKRHDLAEQLLGELPTRITNGEMDVKEAQRIMSGLLNDAEPNAQARSDRAAALTKRLTEVAASVAAASQAQ